MRNWIISLLVAALLGAGILYVARDGERAANGPGSALHQISRSVQELKDAIDALSARMDRLASDRTSEPAPEAVASSEGPVRLGERLAAIETAVKGLQELLETKAPGTVAAPGSTERDFAADDGFALADALLEQGRLTTAANGYLAFLRSHPDHPDAKDLWKKARNALWKAQSYTQAIGVHEELMARYPELQAFSGFQELAMIEKDARRWEDAKRHLLEAATRASTREEKGKAYRQHADIVLLSEGEEAGLRAYQNALSQCEKEGIGTTGEAKSIQQKIAWLQRQLGAQTE